MAVINPKTGKEFVWKNPPTAQTRAHWDKKTVTGHVVQGSVRHIAHLDRLDNLSQARFHQPVRVYQSAYSTGVPASAGTHDYDMVADLYIPNVDWWAQQRFFRRNGFACWYRHAPLFMNHIHGFTLCHHSGSDYNDDWAAGGFKVGLYIDGGVSTHGRKITSSQRDDYQHHAFGLAGMHTPNSDKSWFPANIEDTVFDLHGYIERHKRLQAA